MNIDIKFYWYLFLERLPIMFVIVAISTAIGLAYALTAPAVYRASALLLVESPQIPDELAASTVNTPSMEQLEIIEQSIQRRSKMIDLANEFGVFDGQERLSPDEIVDQMRDLLSVSTTGGRGRATQVLISFDSGNANTSAGVVNDLTTLVLSEHAVRRQSQAGQTLDFFDQEVERLDEELVKASVAIVEFKEANAKSLPENADFMFERQSRLLDIVRDGREEMARIQSQRNRLIELGTTALGGADLAKSAAEVELAALESEYEQARRLFSDANPRVKVLAVRVEAVRERVERERGSTSEASTVVDPTRAVLELQLAEVDDQLERINRDITAAEEELLVLEDNLERVPEVRIRLEALEREYQNIQDRYNRTLNSLAVAQTGERIETLSRGQRITVLEQAVPPVSPTSPNRKLIAGGGAFVGVALATVFFVLAELLNKTVRRPADVVSRLGIQPLATIPYLETAGAIRRRRVLKWIFALVVAVGIPVALWVVHTMVVPLDVLAQQLLARVGM